MPKINLADNLAARDADADTDALLSNCFAEADQSEGSRIVKRPGYSLTGSLGVGCAQGSITYNNNAVFIQKDTIYTNFFPAAAGALWTVGPSAPKPTAGQAFNGTSKAGYLLSLDGVLYQIGGQDAADANFGVYKSTDNGVTWTTILAPGSGPWTKPLFQSQMAVVHNGRMFIFLSLQPTSQDWEVWSSSDGVTWIRTSAGLTGALIYGNGHGVVSQNGIIYALFQSQAGFGAVFYSADGITWTAANTNTGWGNRQYGAVFALNGNLYIAGGITASGDVWRSSNNGVTWTQITAAAAFGVRKGAAAFTYDNKLWIAGGNTGIGNVTVNDVYLSADGITWILVTAAAAWTPRAYMAYTLHNGTMYVGPGFTTSGGSFATVIGTFFAAPGGAVATALPSPDAPCQTMQITLIPASGIIPVRLFIKSNLDAWVFDGVIVTKVTDPDYPATTVPGVAYLDGAIYVMDDKGVVYGSDLGDPLAWNALNFISANSEADAGVCLARQLQYIIAFKSYSVEVFYDAGNPTGSPLAKVQSALLEVGMASATSAAYSENTVYFVANSREKGRSILKMEGYTPQSVSIPGVERILNADDLATVWAFCIKISGHFFYVLTLKTSGITLAFDSKTGVWGRWTNLTPLPAQTIGSLVRQADGSIFATMALPHGQADGDVAKISGAVQSEYNGTFNITFDPTIHSALQFSYIPVTVPSVSPATGAITAVFYQSSYFPAVYYAKDKNSDLLLDEATGGVYSFDPTIFQDNGQPIDLKVRTNRNDFDTPHKKIFTSVMLDCDQISGNVLLRYSSTDYQTYSIYRQMDAGSVYPRLNRLGKSYRRAWEFRFTGNSAFRARYMHADVG